MSEVGHGDHLGRDNRAILALRDHLVAAKVTYMLADELEVMLVNAAAVRNLPGRNTPICRMRRGWPIWVRTGW